MDEEKYLFLIKDKDQTADIQSYEVDGSFFQITFRSSSKPYRYSSRDILILKDPIITEITEKMVVYHNDIPLYSVCRVMSFGPKSRIQFRNGKNSVYSTSSIRVECSGVDTVSARRILHDWTNISQHTGITDQETEEETFLKKRFDKLTFVSPSSVLNCYLNGNSVKVNPKKPHNTIFPFKFNISQKEALDHALRSQISIIEGPPGTGKTQTILNILANLAVMQNKTVAVVAGNNAAVQNVKDKLAAAGYHFLVAALGNKKNKTMFFDNPHRQDVSAWKSHVEEGELLARIQELNGRLHNLMEVERDKAKLEQKLSAYRLERDHFETFYDKQDVEQIRKLSFYRQTPEKILSFLIDNHIATETGKAGSIFYKLKLLLLHGFTDFKRLKHREIDVILNAQRKFYELKIEKLGQRIAALQRMLEKGSFESLMKQHQKNSEELFRHKLYQKYHDLEPIQADAKSYKKIFDKFIEQYPILLSTTHSLRDCVPENYLFDYVIIDESSQVDLLTGALALSCCRHAVIIGDTKQLPQIVDENIKKKIDVDRATVGGVYDYFQQNLLSSVLALYGDSVPKVMLKEHYRCHPKIIEFCNQKYYDGNLIAYTSEEEEDNPLLIYRTAPGNHMREVTHGQKGRFNQRELDVIHQEVLKTLKPDIQKYSDIGFATPFRKQVEKAGSQLDKDIESDTIHKYQGREKPTMILSTVLDHSRSGKMVMQFVSDPRMINVAVSRAQKRFILVTDNSLFMKYGSEIGDLMRYMEYSTLDENIVESDIVSVFDLLYKEYSEKLRAFKSRIKQHSKYESENIMRTLLSEILQEPSYRGLEMGEQVLVRNLLNDRKELKEEERRYVKHRASVDFVLYHKLDKRPVLVIEVDGFAYHENDPKQLERDRLKDSILETYGLPFLRLPTTGSEEEGQIKRKLDGILNS